jgi:IMP dehydrogenase
MKEMLSFDDVILIPKHSNILSRSLVDTSSELRVKSGKNIKLDVPIISSPMDTVTEDEMAFRMFINGGCGIIHRYNTIEKQIQLVYSAFAKFIAYTNKSPSEFVIGAAVGITGDYLDRTKALINAGVKIICIDVAHGHHENVLTAGTEIRKLISDDHHLMVGNVGPIEGYKFLAKSKLFDSIRVGISSGSICSSAPSTGFGYMTFQSLYEIGKLNRYIDDPQLIGDGGIRSASDIVKSIAAGADFVMVGSLVAGTKAAPGEKIQLDDGRWMKSYRGMASANAQKARGQAKIREEGISTLVPYKGKLEKVMESMKDGIQGGYSYCGALNKIDLRKYAEFARLTHSALVQSKPHILVSK